MRQVDPTPPASVCNSTSLPLEAGPVILTVATSLPQAWPLGLSAALHGLPLVVIGLGQPGWTWRDGNARKIGLVQSALRVLQRIVPARCCQAAYADATDTVVANAPAVRRSNVDGGWLGLRTVLLSAECNSYPRCYARQYQQQPSHRACLRRSPTCYANSGMYMGGSIRALRQFVKDWRGQLEEMERSASATAAERGNDQSALHRLLLAGDRRPEVQIDDSRELMLSLYACQGASSSEDGPDGYSRKCFDRPYDPFRELAMKPMNDTGVSSSVLGPVLRSGSRPFLLHANGDHARLHTPELAPLMHQLTTPSPAMLRHPVLLLESASGASCRMTTLGEVMAPSLERAQQHTSMQSRRLRRRARHWLAAAKHGYCAATSDAGDCERGHKGSWPLHGGDARTWEDAAATCLRQCADCKRCRYVSVSLWSMDCSWFAACDERQLESAVAGFRTARAVR